jgi:hypothetical protein
VPVAAEVGALGAADGGVLGDADVGAVDAIGAADAAAVPARAGVPLDVVVVDLQAASVASRANAVNTGATLMIGSYPGDVLRPYGRSTASKSVKSLDKRVRLPGLQAAVAHSLTVNPTATGTPDAISVRAQKAQKVARISAGAIFVVFGGVALTLRGKTESGQSYFHPSDQVAMTLLGVLAAVAILWFTRPRLIADRSGIRVRNLLGWIEVPWEIVAAVRFDRGSPWAAIDLQDDDVISVMAIQAADKDYAVDAVRKLRAMLSQSRETVAAE